MDYTIDYFINKFSAIPDDEMGDGRLENKCAMFYCGITEEGGDYVPTDEALALAEIFAPFKSHAREEWFRIIYRINDTRTDFGNNPKERILTALKKAKELQQKV